jgi:hypothetical protein
MSDVFNTSPSAFVDMNNLFAVLNDKVGLTSTQWQKAIENTFFLYNHLGLADVDVGTVTTNFTAPATLADVVVTHREVTVGDKTTDYFDYVFNIPTPNIVATLSSQTTQDPTEVGMVLTQTPIYGTGVNANVIVGYNFSFNAKLPASIDVSNFVVSTQTISSGVDAQKQTIINNDSSANYVEISADRYDPGSRNSRKLMVSSSGVTISKRTGSGDWQTAQEVATEDYVDDLVGDIVSLMEEL